MEPNNKTALKVAFLYTIAAIIYSFISKIIPLLFHPSTMMVVLSLRSNSLWLITAAAILIYLINRLSKENVSLRDIAKDPFALHSAGLMTVVKALFLLIGSLVSAVYTIIITVSGGSSSSIRQQLVSYGVMLVIIVLYLLAGIIMRSKAKAVSSESEQEEKRALASISYLFAVILFVVNVLNIVFDFVNIRSNYFYYLFYILAITCVLLYYQNRHTRNQVSFRSVLTDPIVCHAVGPVVLISAILSFASSLSSFANSFLSLVQHLTSANSLQGVQYGGLGMLFWSVILHFLTLVLYALQGLAGYWLLRKWKLVITNVQE